MAAEEMAQKAVVNLLFPTALFILPALFMAIRGPLGPHVMEVLQKTPLK